MDLLFKKFWDSYTEITPSADKIKKIFESNGEVVSNDHVAFRTIDAGEISIANLQTILFELGYKVFDTYLFKEKKLIANAYINQVVKEAPKIFLSGLQLNYLSDDSQEILWDLVDQSWDNISYEEDSEFGIFTAGRLWDPISIQDYQTLSKESEYAAWVASHGLRPNHFTVSINHLTKTPTVESVLDLVESNGFKINEIGSRVKGSKDVFLEQGSTMADQKEVKFSDGSLVIPTCYYEFALRHQMPNGELYQGFVEKSADKIFQSTDKVG